VAPDTLVGKPAPAFALPDQDCKSHSLAEAKGKWVVLAFYPKDQTTGCTFQNRAYTAKYDEFAKKNAVVYTVSTQDSKSHAEFCSKEGLKHTLLADVGGKAAADYGVLMPDNGLAKRITFYIAPDGRVASVDTSVRPQSAADDSLVTLTRLQTPQTGEGTPTKTIDGQKVTTGRPVQGYFGGPADTKVRLGEPVAEFALTDVTDGKRKAFTTLSAGKKASVIVYVSTECPVSNAYNQRLAQLATDYQAKGVRFIGIDSNEGEAPADIAALAQKASWSFPVLKDDKNIIADRFEAQVTPEVYITDGKGVLVYHGPIDDSQNEQYVKTRFVANALDALLAGQPAPAATKRAFGCGIKRVAAK
jgi:peroxiredoxin